jgi:transcriptional regulator with XRE-family HTH domain
MPKRAIEVGATGRQAAANLLRLRKVRGYSVRKLSALLAEAGRHVSPSGITWMEHGQRRIDVDDLVALAAVLNVAPSAFLLPLIDNPMERLEITGAGHIPADEAWDWLDGRRRLDRPSPDPGAAAIDFALHSRPPLRRGKLTGGRHE